jgi:hypothetical protein
MKRFPILLTGAALLLTLACGGGSGTPATPATSLAYAFSSTPVDTEWRLMLDTAHTTSTHLEFDLYAPTGTTGDGFTVTLTTAPSQAVWVKVDGTNYLTQTLFASPKVKIASVSGGSLRIVVGQVPGSEVSYGSTSLAHVALEKASGATVGSVTLTATPASHLTAAGDPTDITVSIGTLTASAS